MKTQNDAYWNINRPEVGSEKYSEWNTAREHHNAMDKKWKNAQSASGETYSQPSLSEDEKVKLKRIIIKRIRTIILLFAVVILYAIVRVILSSF